MENNEQKMKKSISPLMFVFAGVVLAAGLILILSKNFNKNEEVNAALSKPTESVKDSPIPQQDKNSENSEVKTVEIEAGSFYFKPNEIRVKKGEKVKIIFKSVDMMHNFNIDELNIRVPVTRPGNISTAEFTADQAGTFEYYCSVGNHRRMGQVGKLMVE